MKVGRFNLIARGSESLCMLPPIENSRFEVMTVGDLLDIAYIIGGDREVFYVEYEIMTKGAYFRNDGSSGGYIKDQKVLLLRTEIEVEDNKKLDYEPFYDALKIIQLLRLFNGNDIYMFYFFNYYYDNGEYKRAGNIKTWSYPYNYLGCPEGRRYIFLRPYALTQEEALGFIEFYNKYCMHLGEKKIYNQALANAYAAYNEAYTANELGLAFILLISALESLFSNDKIELRYRLSRNVAIALSDNVDSARELFDKVRKYYDKRSDYVHGVRTKGKDRIKYEDLFDLRDIVRKSILYYFDNGLNTVEFNNKKTREAFFLDLTLKGFN